MTKPELTVELLKAWKQALYCGESQLRQTLISEIDKCLAESIQPTQPRCAVCGTPKNPGERARCSQAGCPFKQPLFDMEKITILEKENTELKSIANELAESVEENLCGNTNCGSDRCKRGYDALVKYRAIVEKGGK